MPHETCNLFKDRIFVCPRDFLTQKILLAPKTIIALKHAAKTLETNSNGRYALVLTRGYVHWGKWRRFCGQLAKFIFCALYWSDRTASELLFGHNGHNDGYSVDVQLYDLEHDQTIHWLSWKNIMISRTRAEKIIDMNKDIINILDTAMQSADFTAHVDPREKLQMHYRLNTQDKDTLLVEVSVMFRNV